MKKITVLLLSFALTSTLLAQQASNHVNNASIAPYYGEIPYSGRSVVLGYFGNQFNNPIFKKYGSDALIGPIKIIKR